MRILAVGAHPDDIEIGCGGTLAAHIDRGDHVVMLVMTRGELAHTPDECRLTEQAAAAQVLGAELAWGDQPDGHIELRPAVEAIEAVLAAHGPFDTVYGHTVHDTHQDHRVVAAAVHSAARRVPSLLGFASPSTHTFTPTVFVPIGATLRRKMAALVQHGSQTRRPATVDLDAIQASAAHWGFHAKCGGPAEAFEPLRIRVTV